MLALIQSLQALRRNDFFVATARQAEVNRALGENLELFRTSVYRASEYAETICDKLAFSIVPKNSPDLPKLKGAKTLRRNIDIICNKLKHEQNQMVSVNFKFKYAQVPGVSVCAFDGDGALSPNPDIHAEREAFSLFTEIADIFATLYALGEIVQHNVVAPLIPRLTDDEVLPTQDLIELFKELIRIPRIGFPDHGAKHSSRFIVDDNRLVIRRGMEALTSAGPPITISSIGSGDGVTRNFHIFYGSLKLQT